MRRHRFVVGELPEPGEIAELLGDEHEHLSRVLRLRAGDRVFVFDGRGREAAAVVEDVGGAKSRLRVGELLDGETDSRLEVVVLQSLAAGERVDVVVRRASELGVGRIRLLATERTPSTGRPFRASRLQRWRRIALEAAKQSGRRTVPGVDGPEPRGAWPSLGRGAVGLLLDPEADVPLVEVLVSSPAPRSVVVAVGPEGGWSEGDRAAAADAGYQAVRLGPRVLRTEAAAPAAVALLQGFWGDFR